MNLPIVELHSAFVWTCDDCGRDNYERSIDVTDSSTAVNPDDDEVISGMEGGWYTYPDRVECRACGAKYAAVACGQEDEGKEDGHP